MQVEYRVSLPDHDWVVAARHSLNLCDIIYEQPHGTYKNLRQLLIHAANGKNYDHEFEFVIKFHGNDFEPSSLKVQLETLCTNFISMGDRRPGHITLPYIFQQFHEMSKSKALMFLQILVLIRLILVMPATNATSEKSFSALRRVKTYLRTTTRLN